MTPPMLRRLLGDPYSNWSRVAVRAALPSPPRSRAAAALTEAFQNPRSFYSSAASAAARNRFLLLRHF